LWTKSTTGTSLYEKPTPLQGSYGLQSEGQSDVFTKSL